MTHLHSSFFLAGAISLAAPLVVPSNASAAEGVAMYCGEGGYCNQTASTLEAFETAGASPVLEIETLDSLDDYRVLIVMSPRDGLSAASHEALVAFAGDPESWLVLVGDRPEGGFELANLAINDVLVDLGLDGAMVLDAAANVGDLACAAPADEIVTSHPLLDGVEFIDTNRSARIEVGTGDALVVDGGNVVLAAADNVVLSADSNIFAEGCGFEPEGNLRLFSNLFSVAPPAPPNDGGTGDDTGPDPGDDDDDDDDVASGSEDEGGDDATDDAGATMDGTGGSTPAVDGDSTGCGCQSSKPGPGGVAGLAFLCMGLLRRRSGRN